MSFAEAVVLRGEHALLEPLAAAHVQELNLAVLDGDLSALWFTSVPSSENMAAEIERRLGLQAQGLMLPFVVREVASGEVVGMTNYLNIDACNRRLEIGATWYAQRVQRTPLNTECKLLLLQHAFEKLECIAVEFRTHWLNPRSRAAILRLGAKQDGVLRNHSVLADGSYRDTVVFSIIESEWPAVRAHLEHKLHRG